MKRYLLTITFIILFQVKCLYAAFVFQEDLLRDIEVIEYWNRRIDDRLPVMYNHLLQGGYFSMPSALMGEEGEVGFGYASVPPYRIANIRMQLIDRLELTGNYRIFEGIPDPVLGPMGFGDFSDKGANVKLALFHPEDSQYLLPGIAIGYEDFMGTRAFNARYVVATQVVRDYNFEVSLGYGGGRIHGFFGGFTWFPFRTSCYSLLESFCLVAEYDAIKYKSEDTEPHPDGRKKRFPINIGVKYRLWDMLDFSASYIRGDAWAFSLSSFYNFGCTDGLIPKIDNPLPYLAPIITEPLGSRRPERILAQDLLYAMRDQGFDLLALDIGYDTCENKVLWIKVYNFTYRTESEVRDRLNHLLASLVPSDIDRVIVVIEDEGFPIQEYHFVMEYVRDYAGRAMGAQELKILSPLCEVADPELYPRSRYFEQGLDWWNIELMPKVQTLFGGAKGKLKYSLGLSLALNGFLWDDLFYSIRVGYTFFTDLHHLSDVDRLNPSQIINVRSDIINYYKVSGLTLDEAYLQKNWNLGRGWFSKLSSGLFEEAYGGVAGEILYYPINNNWAVGAEAAYLRKRVVGGIGFNDEVRKLHHFEPSFRRFHGSQCFLDFYYTWREAELDFKIMFGKFLANDIGARFEITRYFPSGMRITFWYTATDGNDRINGQLYHDKGIAISLPLDIFYTHADRSRWGYGMSAWLRDVGVTGWTGKKLFDMIREQRVQR